MVDWALGSAVSREYSLQDYHLGDSGTIRLRETSLASATSGVMNAAFETELGPKSRLVLSLKALRRKMNTEGRAGGLTEPMKATWAVLKFVSEAQSLRELKTAGYVTPEGGFEEYARRLADFTLRHTLMPHDPVLQQNLSQLIIVCADAQAENRDELARRFQAFGNRVLYHFYVHGN